MRTCLQGAFACTLIKWNCQKNLSSTLLGDGIVDMKEGGFYRSKSSKVISICLVSTKKCNKRPTVLQTWQKGLTYQGRTNAGGVIGRWVRGDLHIESTNHTILHYRRFRLCSLCNYSTLVALGILDCGARIRIHIYNTSVYMHTYTYSISTARQICATPFGRAQSLEFSFQRGAFYFFGWTLVTVQLRAFVF